MGAEELLERVVMADDRKENEPTARYFAIGAMYNAMWQAGVEVSWGMCENALDALLEYLAKEQCGHRYLEEGRGLRSRL